MRPNVYYKCLIVLSAISIVYYLDFSAQNKNDYITNTVQSKHIYF